MDDVQAGVAMIDIDGVPVDWKVMPLFPPAYVRAMLAFVFSISERDVHVAVVVDESGTESEFAARALRPVSNAQWLSGRREVSAHRIERLTFDAVWREYLASLDTPLGDPRGSPPSSS